MFVEGSASDDFSIRHLGSKRFIAPALAIIPKMELGNNKLITPMSFYRHCDKVLMISKLVFQQTNDLMVSM